MTQRSGELQDYHDKGYVVLPALFSDSELARMNYEIEQSLKWGESHAEAPFVYHERSLVDSGRQPIRAEKFMECFPETSGLLNDGRIARELEGLTGFKWTLFKDKIVYKLPGASGFAPHQDANHGWDHFVSDYINVMVAIDNCQSRNGCLEVAKGGHRNGLLGQPWHLLSESEIKDLTFEPVLLKPGDVLIFDGLLPHRSDPNMSSTRRTVIFLTYNPTTDGEKREEYFELIPKVRRRFMLNKIRNALVK